MSTLSPERCERELAGMILHSGADVVARAELEPMDFADPRYRIIWQTGLELHAQGKGIDALLVHDRLAELGRIEAVGGYGFLAEVQDGCATIANVEHYAEEIRRFSRKRRLCVKLSELAERARTDHDPQEVIERAYAELVQLADQRKDPTKLTREAVRDMFKAKGTEVDAMRAGDSGDRLLTGLHELDELMGGIRRKVITVLAGGTSHGKSALARTIAMNVARAGHGVHVFSAEDSAESYAERAAADVGDLSLFRVSSAPDQLNASEWTRLMDACDRLWQIENWLIDETAALSAQTISLRVRKHRPKNRTRLVIVDYVQELRDPTVKPGPWARRAHVELSLDTLLQLARSEDVAVLVLSQLSREYMREQRPPEMVDLRETGEIENRAHAILAIYRPEKNERDLDKRRQLVGRAEIRLLKLKGGRAPNQAEIRFDGTTATFRSFGGTGGAQEALPQ